MKNHLSSLVNFFSGFGKKSEIDFCSNGVLTLGVEIELQLIDRDSFNLTPRAEEILKAASSLTKKIKQEFYLSTVEINTSKCFDVCEVEKDLSQSYDIITKIGDEFGINFATTGCHPFSLYSDCVITSLPRYQDLIDRNQWLTRRMTVYGLHVHLGMKSGDDAIRFNNFFLNFVPHLLALSASSPFWQGDDTGLASCRPTTYEALPTAGHPYRARNWNEFEHLYRILKKCKAINSIKDLWWDIRPSPAYGTLEIRACDGPATLDEALAIVAFIHMLSHWFNDSGDWIGQVPPPPLWFSRENKWRVIRHGLHADLVVDFDGATKPISEDILQWLDKLAIYEKKLGYKKYVDVLREIISKGNSSNRQRKIHADNNSFSDVVKFNVEEFLARKPVWN